MRRISYFLVPLTAFLILSCSTRQTKPLQTSLLIYRLDPSAFLEFSKDFQMTKEIPFSIPPNCGLYNTFPAPVGSFLLIELNCPNGQTVLFLDTKTASVSQPVTDSDSHFLAWMSDGKAAYLKIDSLTNPQIIRAYTESTRDAIPIPEFTYDLSARPDSRDFTFTFSRGLGYGSELYLTQRDGRITQLLYADLYNYISFARFSPDGNRIAFIKIPDTQTPFTVGELWVIPANVTSANMTPSSALEGRLLADVDAGHGYAANWSPDGTKIAFVNRENPDDANADQSSSALISNVYTVDVASGSLNQITHYDNTRVETPFWSPDGNTLAFTAVLNGRMDVQIEDMATGEIRSLIMEATCCPAWMRK